MRKLYLLACSVLFSSLAFSQPYENSWISYSQQYYRIKISQDGIYRIGQNALIFSSIPITSINHRRLQLFHNGQEQYIYVFDQNNNDTLDATDYIEFYGEKNDGSFDTRMYASPGWQPNVNYSVINDTAVYFLTWNNSTSNRRLTVQSDTAFSGYVPATYFIRDAYQEETGTYISGRSTSFNGTDIDYIEAEGWMGDRSQTISKNVPVPHLVTSGPDVVIRTSIAGSNNLLHNVHIVSTGIDTNDVMAGYTMRHYTFTRPASLYTAPTVNFTYTSDNIAFSSLSVRYPHTYDLENASSFYLHVPDASGQGKTRMDITNFNGGGNVLMYDITNHRRILVSGSGSAYQALVDNDAASQPKLVFISASSQVRSVTSLSPVNYIPTQPGHFNNFQTLQKDSAFLIITHRTLWAEAQSYKAHRDLTTNNKVVVADIDELYDQFAYGIVKHPMAVKNYVRFLLGNWPSAPEHLFIIGKAQHATAFRKSATAFAACLVPAYGEPASDIPFTSGLNGLLFEPAVPTGRLPATTGQHILDYLGKIQEYETAQQGPPVGWMKEVLHFVGGSSSGQQDVLANYMKKYEGYLEDTSFGGNVTTYQKNSSAPIVINQSDSLQARIDSGVAIMTFFGHASGAGFDVSTDVPSEYNNRGRYPFVMANSCFAGDIHTPAKSVSEQFVLEPYKAAIAFLASVGLGESYYLDKYSTEFFQNVSQRMYGQSVGKIMKNTIALIEDSTDLGIKTVCYELSLNGDPSIAINHFPLPDLSIAESAISFSPATITTELDTLNVNIVVRNIGKATRDSFHVVLKRIYPDAIDSVYVLHRQHCFYADTITVRLPVGGFNAAGLNLFRVEVDQDTNMIAEIEETFNNIASTVLFISSSDIVPVFPYKYSIIPYNNVTFRATTSNPFASARLYKFELDTADFSVPGYTPSPLYRFSTVNGSGGVISWSNAITLGDSLVYYWRVADDSVQYDPVKFKWNQSSFQYIPGKTGWAQAHFHQFAEDDFGNVRFDTVGRFLDFIVNNASLTALTYGGYFGAPLTIQGLNEMGYSLNNAVGEYAVCNINNSIMVAVIDSITLQPWNTVDHPNSGSHNYYNPVTQAYNCRQRAENYFIFRFDNSCPACLDSLGTFLASVPAGNYILVYSAFPANYSNYPLFNSALTNVGFTLTSTIPDMYPFVFFQRRGDPSSVQQLIGTHSQDTVRLDVLLSSVWDRGTVTSPVIGPSTNWTSLHWQQHAVETGVNADSVALNIFGIRPNGDLDTLMLGISPALPDTVLSWIPAAQYPYLRLQAYLKDDSLRSPPQINRWQIYYDDVPEAALNANRLFTFHADPLNEGDTLSMRIAIDNIGQLPMDSLDVQFYLYDVNRVRRNLKTQRLDSLRVNQFVIADIVIDSTFGLAGSNSLWVEANPFGPDHQLEKYHHNNLAEIKFNIQRDIVNPVLDVTFDGIHILNGDIVSGRPAIAIQLHDENQFLALNDTSKFKVYIKPPGAGDYERLFFSLPAYSATMQFTPAVLPRNSARIDFQPVLSTDGIYELMVEAADISNNESGKINYVISFEVINKSTITEVLNYPNPFSTSTRFVFTLTGNEIPTQMKIQIVTVSGKIVREILQSELGNIHIGRNITDYAWDGKDEFGDQLANGLYLYRVITRLNGSDIEKRNTEADAYFKKGWGKMYLMR